MTRSMAIEIDGIELRGRCGVSPEERVVGQTLVVDVRLEPRGTEAGQTDDLTDSVNYSRVVNLVREIVEGQEFHLLERLATVIAERVLAELPVARVEVAVAKKAPPVSIPVPAARVRVVLTP